MKTTVSHQGQEGTYQGLRVAGLGVGGHSTTDHSERRREGKNLREEATEKSQKYVAQGRSLGTSVATH